MAGWWFQPTPLKNDGVNVSWDDYIFPINNSHVPKHRPQFIMFAVALLMGFSWSIFHQEVMIISYPLVMTNIAIENGHRNSWFTQL